MCGDATSEDDFNVLFEKAGGVGVNLLLTDPPYNVEYVGKTKEQLTIANDSMGGAAFQDFLTSALTNACERMEEGASFYIWFASREAVNFNLACERAGLEVKQELIWNKNVMVLGRQDYQWKHEPCLYGWKPGASHYFIDDRTLTTVMEFNKPVANREHPTMKPVDLISHQIKNSSRKGGVVLDMFGGSGTTLIACEQLGRKCLMMEYDPKYIDVIINRWETLTGKKAEKT